MNERKLQPQLEKLSKFGNVLCFIGVLTIASAQLCFAHDPQGVSVASTWSIFITLAIAIAASFFSFRYFSGMTRGRRPSLRFIAAALAIIIPFVLVWCVVFPTIYGIIYFRILR